MLGTAPEHECCWHQSSEAMMILLRPGQIVQVCCKCSATRTVHADHAWDRRA